MSHCAVAVAVAAAAVVVVVVVVVAVDGAVADVHHFGEIQMNVVVNAAILVDSTVLLIIDDHEMGIALVVGLLV